MNTSLATRAADLLARRGVATSAALAVVAGLPSLALPFLSDDWSHLASAADGVIRRTPYGFFRPLCSITYWFEWRVWGVAALPFHLTNLILAALAAALVVVAIRRYTEDAALAGLAGLVFALHPYHIEDVAWIAARSDLLSGVLFICAALAYDRWRRGAGGLPVLSLILFEAALLAKESAVVLPLFLVVLGLVDAGRRARVGEWLRGYLPLAVVALAHFLVLRPLALGDVALGHLKGIAAWKGNLLFFSTSALLPAPTEYLVGRRFAWWGLAAGLGLALVAAAHLRAGRIPPVVWPAAASFVVLLGPSLLSFQQRFFLLPSAAAALALVALLRAADRRVAAVGALLLVGGWSLTAAQTWNGWYTAGRASGRLMRGLVQASATAGVDEIFVAALPHRVRGIAVRADFTRAVPLAGGRSVTVFSAGEIDYPTDRSDALDGPPASAIDQGSDLVEVRLRIPGVRYSRYVWPLRPPGSDRVDADGATILFGEDSTLRVSVPVRPRRAAYTWVGGELARLF